MVTSFSRRKFLKRSVECAALAATQGLIRPRFTYAQGVPSAFKNFVYVFLFGGADPRFIFPYTATLDGSNNVVPAGPVDSAIRARRPNISVAPTDIRTIPGMNQGGRANPVGFHWRWEEMLNKAQSVGAGVQLLTEFGVTDPAKISLSHVTAQQNILNCTTTAPYLLQQGLFGKLIDQYNLPSLSVYGFKFPDPVFMKSNIHPAFQLDSLSAFSFTNRNFGAYFCGTRCGSGDYYHQHADATEDSVLARSIARQLMREPHPEIALDAKLRSTSENIYDSMPVINAMQNVPIDITQFRAAPPYNYSNVLQDTMADITRSIKHLNSSSVSQEIQDSTKLFICQQGGYDAHAYITGYYPWNIMYLANSLKGLIHYLDQWNLLDSTLITVFSEFGREIPQNASYGIDHGKASFGMMIGKNTKVPNRVLGPDPSVDEATNAHWFSPQMPVTEVFRKILAKLNFDSSQLGNVISEHMPGEGNVPELFV